MSFRPKITGIQFNERTKRKANKINSYSISQSSSQGKVLNFSNSNYQSDDFLVASFPVGLNLSYLSSTSIQVEPGYAVTTLGSRTVAYLISTFSKSLNAWVKGSAQGGRFSSLLSNATYHVFVITNLQTGETDVGFDTSVVAANRPSGWSARRIGSILVRSGSILNFTQVGSYFELNVPVIDLDSLQNVVTPSLFTMTVPTGIQVLLRGIASSGLAISSGGYVTISIQSTSSNIMNPVGSSQATTGFRGHISSFTYNDGISINYNSSVSEIVIPTDINGQIQIQMGGSYESGYGMVWQTLGWDDFSLYSGT